MPKLFCQDRLLIVVWERSYGVYAQFYEAQKPVGLVFTSILDEVFEALDSQHAQDRPVSDANFLSDWTPPMSLQANTLYPFFVLTEDRRVLSRHKKPLRAKRAARRATEKENVGVRIHMIHRAGLVPEPGCEVPIAWVERFTSAVGVDSAARIGLLTEPGDWEWK